MRVGVGRVRGGGVWVFNKTVWRNTMLNLASVTKWKWVVNFPKVWCCPLTIRLQRVCKTTVVFFFCHVAIEIINKIYIVLQKIGA